MATATRSAAVRSTRAPKAAAAPAKPETPAAPAPAAVVYPKKAVADKAPSELHKNMAAWLEETTGYKVDLKTVQLVASLRMEFQASEANQKDLAARREAAAKKQQDRVARAQAAAEKAAKRAAELAAKLAK